MDNIFCINLMLLRLIYILECFLEHFLLVNHIYHHIAKYDEKYINEYKKNLNQSSLTWKYPLKWQNYILKYIKINNSYLI